MSRQPNRMSAEAAPKFAGVDIDRSKPLSFRLNGRVIDGFAGDTVLSALLAAGIETMGLRAGEPLGLSERFAPAVVPAASAGDPTAALPMERTPALPGLDLVTLGSLRERLASHSLTARLRRWLRGPGHTLNLRLDDPLALAGSWRDLQPRKVLDADTVVIGGGIAGMSAAVAAAAAGDRVILIERTPALGGNARYFGTVDGEEPPEAAIRRLSAHLSGLDNVSVLTCTEAFALAGTTVRAHQVQVEGDTLAPRSLTVEGKRVVLATGALECRPSFPGNRAPGVSDATAAYQRALRYGVWLGRRALFSTNNNFGYRLALLAKDAGIQVLRIADSRLNPQSRFVDFVKASGITLASSLVPMTAVPPKGGLPGLSVNFAVAIEGISQETAPIHADHLIIAGTWQPDLSLWLMAGGRCTWNARAGWLEARRGLDRVALAGSAAGYRNGSACVQSGQGAVAELHGRPARPIDDQQIDPIFESPDGHPLAGPVSVAGKFHAYLGSGFGLAARAATANSKHGSALPTAAQRHALDLDELAGSVQAGELPPDEAGAVAGERCLGPGLIADMGWRVPPAAAVAGAPEIPSYLAGRFGPRPQLCEVATADARLFETGCLIYSNSDETDPAKAVGVIVGPVPGKRSGGLALLGKAASGADARYFARDGGGTVPVSVAERLKTEN